jgi:peptidoglycan hydrolase-like protein with peptidoglycan-binding domain
VRGFQDAIGIAVDGVVGPITWRALVSGMLAG